MIDDHKRTHEGSPMIASITQNMTWSEIRIRRSKMSAKINPLKEQLDNIKELMDKHITTIGEIQHDKPQVLYEELPPKLYFKLKEHYPNISDDLRSQVIKEMSKIMNFKSLIRDFKDLRPIK